VNRNLFSMTSLTAAINRLPLVPDRIAALNLFSEKGINTTTVVIDEKKGRVSLIPVTERGAPGNPMDRPTRKAIELRVPHLQREGRINADEIQDVRAFGSESSMEDEQEKVDELLGEDKVFFDATHEWHRMGAIKGQVYDSNGTTVLFDYLTEFGMTQTTVAMALTTSTTKVRQKLAVVKRGIIKAVGGARFRGMYAFCGDNFWDELIEHDSVTKTALNWQLSNDTLRNDPLEILKFGGVTWENYTGMVGTQAYIHPDEAYIFPVGVPDMFITRFAPPDWWTKNNRKGLPYHAMSEVARMGKGYDIETQSNPIHINTNPGAVFKLTKV
jgi:hypothetical protein